MLVIRYFGIFFKSLVLALLAEAQGLNSETRVAEIVDLVNSALLACNRYEHLVEGQMEEDINFSASWRRCGFEEDDMDDEGEEN